MEITIAVTGLFMNTSAIMFFYVNVFITIIFLLAV